MQFHDTGPDIPEELIRAQMAGDVVFVVGAGVSQRVGLPSFAQLVAKVYEHLGQACPGTPNTLADVAEAEAWERKEWDRTLGLLEHRIVYPNPNRPTSSNMVRDAVTELVKPPRRAPISHQDILQISRDAFGRPRVVTTNFDTIFERTWKKGRADLPISSSGPGLASVGSPEFHGIMHLHGRASDDRLRLTASNLILTSSDFGEAYLRSGWASRFVYDLLRRYTLVFVGYSADDPPMRYMLEATEAGRLNFPDLRRAYAFASFGEGANADEGSVRARWRAKGLVPILYDNADHTYDNLYQTLGGWAACTRDASGWAEAEITRLAAAPWAEASTANRNKVRFLVSTMSNSMVLSGRATSPDWIECLIDLEARPRLADRDALIWLEHRLAAPPMTQWALNAIASIKPIIARAAAVRLSVSREPVAPLFYKYWRLYIDAFSANGRQFSDVDRWTMRGRAQPEVADYFRIEAVAEVVRPRLELRAPWERFTAFEPEAEPEEPSLRVLCHLDFGCEEWPTWADILAGWPEDAESEHRLIEALGRVLAESYEIAVEAGYTIPEFDRASHQVQLVHALEPDEEAVPRDDRGFAGGHWQRTDSDQHDHSFVPIVRLMSGLWRRLAEHAPAHARAVARAWIDQDRLLFRRLGYWAATISDHGPLDQAAQVLEELPSASFWLEDHTAEAARFWCRHWNTLPAATRRAVERNILKGPVLDLRWPARDRRRVTDSAQHRELARIATAGGRLSARAQKAFERLTAKLANPPAQVSVVEGLRHDTWSGSGRPGDASLVESTPVEDLLRQVGEIEERDQINQSGLWAAICAEQPERALAALEAAAGAATAAHWREFLNSMVMTFREEVDEARIASVIAALGALSGGTVQAIAPSLGSWLKSLVAATAFPAALRPGVLDIWDRLFAAVEHMPEEDHRSGQRDLAHDSLNHPAGDVASILIQLQYQHSPKEPDLGLADDLARRFARLFELPAHWRLLALVQLVRFLLFFVWLAPQWAEDHLYRELDRGDENAVQLLSMLVMYGQFYHIPLFNRLKTLICRVIVDGHTESEVRDRLAQFITWAVGRKMAGAAAVDLTEAEARQLLTRSPASSLRSIAWSLWRGLAEPPEGQDEDIWVAHVRPLLERVWPNDAVARNPATSKMLIKIPAATGPHFVEAVQLILRLVVPVQMYSVLHELELHEKPEIIQESPEAVLDLASASIDLNEELPYDLAQFLDALVAAAPQVRDDARYVALRNALRRI